MVCYYFVILIRLLFADGVYRLHGHGPVGRCQPGQCPQHGKQHAHAHRRAKRHLEMYILVRKAFSVDPHLRQLEHDDAKRQSCQSGQRGQHQALGQYLLEDVARSSPDGTADAYLRGAFAHGDHHNVRHADSPCKQRPQPDHPDEDVYTQEQVVHGREDGLGIEQHERLAVIGSDVVRGLEDTAYLRLQVTHPIAGAGRVADNLYLVAQVICVLHRGKGQMTDSSAEPWILIFPLEAHTPMTR